MILQGSNFDIRAKVRQKKEAAQCSLFCILSFEKERENRKIRKSLISIQHLKKDKKQRKVHIVAQISAFWFLEVLKIYFRYFVGVIP